MTTRLIWTAPATPVRDVRARVALVVGVGLAIGCLTSFGQAHLDGALNALVNSVGAWLVAPFFLGALMRTARGAVAAGLVACALQVVGYYVTAELRGFAAGGSIVVFWTACAVVGGPLLGLAGHHWRARPDGLGATVLPAVFLAEGLWTYAHELGYYDTAALWLGIGALLAVVLGRRAFRWFALTVPLGLAGAMLMSLVYSQAF